jgi:hypothetical protein
MRNNKYLRVSCALIIALVMAALPMIAASALAPPEAAQEDGAAAWQAVTETTSGQAVTKIPTGQAVTTQTPEPSAEPQSTPAAFTPDGNLTLVDDVSGEQSEYKQFLTVVTKSGNYFYIVIDRAGDTENVHFMNLVDESDLLALIEGGETAAPEAMEPEPVTPASIEPEAEPEQEPESGMSGILGIVVLLALIGGGALFYFKVLKPKRSAAGVGAPSELDDFDDYLDSEPSDDGLEMNEYGDEPGSDNAEPPDYGREMYEYGDGTVRDEAGEEPETEETK